MPRRALLTPAQREALMAVPTDETTLCECVIRPNQLSGWRRLAKDGALVLPVEDGDVPGVVFAPLVVCDAKAPAPDADNRPAGRGIRIVVGDVVLHLDADTPSEAPRRKVTPAQRNRGNLPAGLPRIEQIVDPARA